MKYFVRCMIFLASFSHIHGYSMEMVNNKDFALILARVYLIEKYGVENVKRQEPLKIEDLKEKWKINGTLISGHLGGVAEIEIRKQDGAILKIRHGK